METGPLCPWGWGVAEPLASAALGQLRGPGTPARLSASQPPWAGPTPLTQLPGLRLGLGAAQEAAGVGG